ncbi:hypothetical protein BD289DRAFT_177500 [Coniella lustricola]|uniref:Rhodopsin domain-containing protein n=1 Tax=Coniella lustricola TaxID=2025994 RepID=A0A2T2ZTJ2_9PEZI|nr:hypothetical protein BD289DRAFT_177500 [Coniella lustricola]
MQPGGNSSGLMAVAIIAIVLGTISVALRLYTRRCVLKQIWLDDYFAVASWACLIAVTVSNFHSISTGLGSHMDEIPSSVLPAFLKDLWLGLVIYNIALVFLKLTLFFQFYRIIRSTSWHGLKIFNIVVMCLIAGWQGAQVFVQIFACVPVERSWDSTVEGTCQSINVTRTMNIVGNIVTDFIILLLPLPTIWRLSLPKRTKYAVMGIFSLGFFTCIVSILRGTLNSDETGGDVSWDSVSVIAWTTAELLTGVVIASLSTMRPLISRYLPGFSMTGSSRQITGTAGASYGLQQLTNKTAMSRADSKSAIMSRSSRFSKNGWMDLNESDREDMAPSRQGNADLATMDTAQLESGLNHVHGNIRVTTEWSVSDGK